MLCQIAARVGGWCIQQIFDVLLFRHHVLDDTALIDFYNPLTHPELAERKS
jgi:hypothetical protein